MNRKLHIFFILLLWSLTSYGQSREIWEIQGNGSSSPFANQIVTTTDNVVTVVFNNLLFIQTPDERADANELTSNGLLVNINPSINVQIGDRITVTGQVVEFDGMTQIQSTGLVLNVLGNNATIPAAIQLDENFPSKVPVAIPQLEQVEGMLVTLSQAIRRSYFLVKKHKV